MSVDFRVAPASFFSWQNNSDRVYYFRFESLSNVDAYRVKNRVVDSNSQNLNCSWIEWCFDYFQVCKMHMHDMMYMYDIHK